MGCFLVAEVAFSYIVSLTLLTSGSFLSTWMCPKALHTFGPVLFFFFSCLPAAPSTQSERTGICRYAEPGQHMLIKWSLLTYPNESLRLT